MTLVRMIARPLLASMFVVGGLDSVRHPATKVPRATKVTDRVPAIAERFAPGVPVPTDPETLVRINGAVQVAAGLALATGRAPRLAALTLVASLVPTTYAGHPFWEEKDPGARAAQRTQFFKNLSMIGGLLLAGVDTEARPGVAWRTRRAARDVRREAKVIARQARNEARVAKARLS
ncbi:MAG: DoxX family protein [Nocardioides sp.]|nr:DoxX family protein [Nocardioides sp.]